MPSKMGVISGLYRSWMNRCVKGEMTSNDLIFYVSNPFVFIIQFYPLKIYGTK